MTSLLFDVRYAWRNLTRTPLFAVIAIASIALGVGANTAVFTLLDQVALRRLPVERPSELAHVSPAPNSESYGGDLGDGSELSWPMYLDLRDHNDVFTGMCARFITSLHVGYRSQSERVNGELVSGTYFPVLGVGAALGRVLTKDDDRVPGGHPVAVLGYDYWQGRFAGDRTIVGRTIVVNAHPLTVVGVAAPGFHGIDLGQPAQLFVPVMMQPQMGPLWLDMNDRRFRWVLVFGRLRPGVSLEQARGALQPYYTSVLQTEAKDKAFANASLDVRKRFLESKLSLDDASRGRSDLRASVTRPLQILMAAAVGVLLIACANLANLLIARGTSRQREIALRLALGAGRARVIWLLLVEAMVLATLGGAAGLFVATWGAGLLLGFFVTPEAPLAVAASPDARTLGFMIAIAVGTAMLAGIAPAVRSTRLDLIPALKGSGGVVREQPHLRKTLVVVQVALSFLMLAGAGVFLRSLNNLLRSNPGFVVDRVVSFSVDLERSGYGSARSAQFARDLLAAVHGAPGVSSSGFANMGLLEGSYWGMGLTVEGFQAATPGEGAGALVNAVSAGLFDTLRVPIVLGRDFNAQDEGTPPEGQRGWPYRTAIVNETFVRKYFGGRSPIGRHFGIGEDPGTPTPIEIVGVVRDAKYGSMREEARPQIFVPAFQGRGINNITVYVRSNTAAAVLVDGMRRIVAGIDPAIPIFNVATLDERVARSTTNERLIASLSTGFGVLATLLSVVGLYGVMAYMVTRRTREIGIRMALGALASSVAWRVLREAGGLVGAGLVLALPAAWWLGRYVESQLFGVRPLDALTMSVAAATLALVATLAVVVPARRAARVDPISALRQD